MSSFRNFTAAAKKFAPKNPRERVDAMSNKPCPLHDQSRKRPCKQAKNPLDICQHFQPTRSRCAHTPPSVSPTCTHRSPRAHARVIARVRRSTSALNVPPVPPVPPVPLRHDGTDHLPVQSIAYGSVGGPSTFRGVQSTLDGGVITPPSNGMALPAAIAAGTSGAVASGAATSGAAASGAAASGAAGAAASGAAASGAAASGAAASGAQSPRHCRYSTPSSSRDGGVE
jgi:hypothetical protein